MKSKPEHIIRVRDIYFIKRIITTVILLLIIAFRKKSHVSHNSKEQIEQKENNFFK